MSEVQTEQSGHHLGRLGSYALLAGTILAIPYVGIPVIAAAITHFYVAGAAIVGGVAAAKLKPENKYVKAATSFLSKLGHAYKDMFHQLGDDWKGATSWAKEKEAASKVTAPEASGGTSPLASKEAANDFSAAAEPQVTVKHAAPAPAPSAIARLGR